MAWAIAGARDAVAAPSFLPRFTLRGKLALVALVLLLLPWVGYRYVQEMERFLLEGQEQALIATARAVATALHERPQLMNLRMPLEGGARRAAEPPAVPGLSEGETVVEPPQPEGEVARESALDEGKSVAEVAAILRGLERTTSRIWVVNRELRVLALAGSLKGQRADRGDTWWRALLGRLIQRPAQDFDDAVNADVLAGGREVSAALLGAPAARVRKTSDGRAVIVSAAHPIWAGDTVVGAVVVEETTNSIVSVRSRALERLLILTLTVFAFAALAILWFATRLSGRIRRLRDEAESAIDARGRLTGKAIGSSAGDEIGDLSRSFSELLRRLSQHHGYLESLASRLSHELRTPMAVIRSSLENLKLQPLPAEARVYMERAEEGLQRLNRILTRMAEATRLEQSLQSTEHQRYDLAEVVRACVSGYELAYPQRRFELQILASPVHVSGQPDLAAQLLDKLVANAVDFSLPEASIRIVLELGVERALLRVINQGPPLPDQARDRLFESMVSVRPGPGQGEPHLGLGLYIARLIAEFHGGWIKAENLPAGDGVMITAAFRLD